MQSNKLMIFIVSASLLTHPAPTIAHPPEGKDLNTTIGEWYRSLRDKAGNGCCSEADCRPVQAQLTAAGWEVFVDKKSFGEGAPDEWRLVPDKAVIIREDNPTGRNVACWTPSHGFYCFTAYTAG